MDREKLSAYLLIKDQPKYFMYAYIFDQLFYCFEVTKEIKILEHIYYAELYCALIYAINYIALEYNRLWFEVGGKGI